VLELRRRTEEIYARHTGQEIERLHDDMERDRFFSATEAVDYGLVDRVVQERKLPRRTAGFAASGRNGG
jgi:ATP-dependent Clp protease, protease subunit